MTQNIPVSGGWGIDLWDQFDPISAHTQQSIEFCEKFGSFVKERCIIEKEYATKIKKLVRHYQPKKIEESEFTYVKGFFCMINEVFDMAGQHEEIADNLHSMILVDLLQYIQELKQDRKKHLLDASKLMSSLQNQLQSLEKAKQQYEKAYRDSEKWKEIHRKSDENIQLSRAEVEKARITSLQKQQQCEQSKAGYASELQKTNQEQQQHYSLLLPRVYQNLQEMEENRIDKVRVYIQKSADIETNVLSILNTCISGINRASSAVVAAEDSKLVIDKFKSGYLPPSDIPFVDQSSVNHHQNGNNSPKLKETRPAVRTNSAKGTQRGTRHRASSRKRSGVFNLFGSKQDEDEGGDYGHLPPNQQKKKLHEKIKHIKNLLLKTTAERDGLLKLQDVYNKDSKLGNPKSLNKQLEEVAQQLDWLKQELIMYEDFLANAEMPNLHSDSLSSSNSNISISSVQHTPNHSTLTIASPETPVAPVTPVTPVVQVNNKNVERESSCRSTNSAVSQATSGAEQDSFEDLQDHDDEIVAPLGTCVALYSFHATNEGAITMSTGQQFMIIEKDQGDGWTRVRAVSGEDGFVPTSYVDCRYASTV